MAVRTMLLCCYVTIKHAALCRHSSFPVFGAQISRQFWGRAGECMIPFSDGTVIIIHVQAVHMTRGARMPQVYVGLGTNLSLFSVEK